MLEHRIGMLVSPGGGREEKRVRKRKEDGKKEGRNGGREGGGRVAAMAALSGEKSR